MRGKGGDLHLRHELITQQRWTKIQPEYGMLQHHTEENEGRLAEKTGLGRWDWGDGGGVALSSFA